MYIAFHEAKYRVIIKSNLVDRDGVPATDMFLVPMSLVHLIYLKASKLPLPMNLPVVSDRL